MLLELYSLWELGSRERIAFTEVLGADGIKVSSRAMTREWMQGAPKHRDLVLADIEDYEAARLVAVDWGRTKNGRRGDLRFTRDGAAYVRRLTAAPQSDPLPPIGLDWEADVRPVLQAIYDLEQVLAPGAAGVAREAINRHLRRAAEDPATDRVLARLSSSGYLVDELTVEEIDAPVACRLSEKGLQQIANWPGAPQTDLAAQFLALIDATIADPDTPEEERTRLSRLRDTAGEVGQGVFTSLLAAYIKSQTGI